MRGLWITFCGLAALLAVAFQVETAQVRYLDADELEHLNAAWLVSKGGTLYEDVFENHPPLMALLLQPIVRSAAGPEAMVHSARGAMLALALATLVVVGWIAARLGGLACAASAVLLLATHTFFFQKGLEVRPDVPALLLIAVALALLALRPGAMSWLAAGALLGLAALFTPKVVYAGAGAALGSAVAGSIAAERGRFAAAMRALGWIALGGGIVAGIAALAMARDGILGGFVSDVLGTSLRMRIDDASAFRVHYLLTTLRANPAMWALALFGVIAASRVRDRVAPTSTWVLGASLAAGVVGLFLIQAPMRQYFLTFLVPVACFGALGAVRIVAWSASVRRGAGALVLAAVVAAVLVPPALELRRDAGTMQDQLGILTKVLELTGPEDRVFDCWTGLYLTRRPASRHFYLNTDVQRLLGPGALEAEVLPALRNPEVRLVISDEDCGHLPSSIQSYVQQEFAPVPGWPFLLLRRPAAPEP